LRLLPQNKLFFSGNRKKLLVFTGSPIIKTKNYSGYSIILFVILKGRKGVLMKILVSRPLCIQLIFTALAFAAMAFLSYLFMRDAVNTSLLRNAESVFSFAKTQLESDLLEPKLILRGFSQTVRNMILRGDTADSIKDYVIDISDYLHTSDLRVLRSTNMYVYIESPNDPVFLSNTDNIPEGFIPERQPWFMEAISNCGSIIETAPYKCIFSGATIITYARCIHDNENVRMAVIGLDVNIDDIGEVISEITLEQGGYGILISQNFLVLAHDNPEYIGKYAGDSDLPFSVFWDDFLKGNDVVKRPLVNWKNEKTVAFFKKMNNGWYLGLLMLEGPFYRTITNMAFTLFMLGTIFAAALIMILIRIDAAKNKSDRESRHKSAFLANMSHEIRTPMNAIIGMTAIGKSSGEIERKDHCFNKIEDASNHLLGVINDILDMSKIEANKFELSPVEFNFEKMLQRIVNVVNFRVDEKHQRLSVYIDKDIPKNFYGDDQRLTQVVTNLLGNAIKFTKEYGSIHLDTRLVEEVNSICTIQIAVSDTGIGMSSEEQKRIFHSFEQAESSTTRKYGGTGLGLAISKGIVELMGGSIRVNSEVGKGSTFSFTVRMERGKLSPVRLLSADVNLNNVRIMVVDDDQDILDYFMEISGEFNLKCDTALTGEEAIKLVEENGHYHIYFVDWKMPGMDGIQLASELKAHHESVKSVVIMITAAEWTAIEGRARQAGVDKFLSKPLFPSSIANLINEALGIDHKKISELHAYDIEGLFSGRNILLVEDVEINREIVITLLEPTHINIDCAENGLQALKMFSDSPDKYDMIFMDVQMPEMDGYEATRQIRALNIPQAKNIRIVAMTANVFREDIERCLDAGMDNHIGKPLDLNNILEKLYIYMPRKKKNH
jgi:signal transduction histidine kinase/DNA-binding response OmpR family regulator